MGNIGDPCNNVKVKVKLFATFCQGRFNERDLTLPSTTKVIDVVGILEIDLADVALVFINGKHSHFEYVLQDNDTLALFPPIGGG